MHICLTRPTAGGKIPLEQFLDLAESAGFHGADVDMSYAEKNGAAALGDLFASRKLKFGGWGPPVDWRGDAMKQAEGLGRLETMAAAAAELKMDSCCTYILPSSDLPFIENWEFHVARLKPIAQTLAEHGLRFGMEFVAPYHLRKQWKHEFIFSPGQMLELADAVGPNAGLLVDVWHCHTSVTPIEFVAQIPGQKIVLAHLNDAPPDPITELKDSVRKLPGEGVLDLPGFMAALEQAGYDGPVGLEVFSPQLKEMPPAEAARKAWTATAKALPKYA